jgi:hypothetical protein
MELHYQAATVNLFLRDSLVKRVDPCWTIPGAKKASAISPTFIIQTDRTAPALARGKPGAVSGNLYGVPGRFRQPASHPTRSVRRASGFVLTGHKEVFRANKPAPTTDGRPESPT